MAMNEHFFWKKNSNIFDSRCNNNNWGLSIWFEAKNKTITDLFLFLFLFLFLYLREAIKRQNYFFRLWTFLPSFFVIHCFVKIFFVALFINLFINPFAISSSDNSVNLSLTIFLFFLRKYSKPPFNWIKICLVCLAWRTLPIKKLEILSIEKKNFDVK